MSMETDRINPLKPDGSFKEKTAENQFVNQQWFSHSQQIWITSLITGSAYLTGIYGDMATLGNTDKFHFMITARILTFISAMILSAASFKKINGKISQRLLFLYFLFITASECFEVILKPELARQGMPLLILIILFFYIMYPVQLRYAITGSLLSVISYTFILIFVLDVPFYLSSPVIIALLLVFTLSFYFVKNINRAHSMEDYAMMQQLYLNVELQKEIQERKKVQDKLEALATIDGLTKIYNRRYFSELADREIQKSRRTGREIMLLFMDIDHFKKVNDKWGHDTGDKVLVKISNTCLRSIREIDLVGRLGGEEFAFLLPEINIENAVLTAERIRKLVEEASIIVGTETIKVTVSFGVAAYDSNNCDSLDALIKKADTALYKAKENGRNRVEVFIRENKTS